MKPIKTRLLLPEYGRNVQEMVSYLKTIEDRDKRNEQARVVVAIMGNLYPYKRDSEEFRNMLWDHLFMIADFDIDIDSPYPRPTADLFQPTPERIPYNQKYITQKHYGDNFRKLIRQIVLSDESDEKKNAAIVNMAKYIRQQSYNYNKEYPNNEVIVADIQAACGSDFTVSPDILGNTKIEVQPNLKNRVNNRKRPMGQTKNKR